MSAPSKPNGPPKTNPPAGRLRHAEQRPKSDAQVPERHDVDQVEWLPAKLVSSEDDEGDSGTGAIEVRATIGEGGLFVANSYAKIQFELGVSVEVMLEKQALAKAKRGHAKNMGSPFVKSDELHTEQDVGIEIQTSSDEDYEIDMDFGQTKGRHKL